MSCNAIALVATYWAMVKLRVNILSFRVAVIPVKIKMEKVLCVEVAMMMM
jgi:hypothetical protein